MVHNLSILGSTGSIGTQTLDVVDKLGLKVVALAAYRNIELLEVQIRKYRPQLVAVYDEFRAKQLRDNIKDTDTQVLVGMDGLIAAATIEPAELVVNAVVGMVGLQPTLAAAQAKKHSAIFQCLQGAPKNKALKKLILTASGGPFFGKTTEELRNVTVMEALRHPNWSMGAKITIDSATMMNKGLEIIEAARLFDVSGDDIDVVVHRESIIHSLVEYDDNSVIAQLGVPDMRIPIQYAVTYPERYESPTAELNLAQIAKMTFFEPDYETFRCLNACKKALSMGGAATAIANGANEEANQLFRDGKIRFLDIGELVTGAVDSIENFVPHTVEDVLNADHLARQYVKDKVACGI